MIFETTISFTSGEKTKKASYLIDFANTFGETETRIYECFADLADVDILTLRRSRIKEVANSRTASEESIWMAELQDWFVSDLGEDKAISYKIAFYAMDFDSARDFITNYIKQGYAMTLASLKQTKFEDVI